MNYIRKSNATGRERVQLALVGAAMILDGVIAVLSLGFVASDIRCWLLFEVFVD